MNAPQWWYMVSGVFFALGTLFYIALIVLLVILIQRQKGLLDKVQSLIAKVDGITNKVDGIVAKAGSITERVGSQATSAVGNINSVTSAISRKAEWIPIAVILLGAVQSFLANKNAVKKTSPKR